MSPSIKSVHCTRARAMLTANCRATLVFPSPLVALVIAITCTLRSESVSARLVRKLLTLSSNRRMSRPSRCAEREQSSPVRTGRRAISPSTGNRACVSNSAELVTRRTNHSHATTSTNGVQNNPNPARIILWNGCNSTGWSGTSAFFSRDTRAGALCSVRNINERCEMVSNTFSARFSSARLNSSSNVCPV